jgi:hypothetical protein
VGEIAETVSLFLVWVHIARVIARVVELPFAVPSARD